MMKALCSPGTRTVKEVLHVKDKDFLLRSFGNLQCLAYQRGLELCRVVSGSSAALCSS